MQKAPKHLKSATRRWHDEVATTFELDPHHLRILRLACETWDRCQEAREVIDREGLTYLDRFGAPRARPEVAIERDSRIAFARLVRELGLDAVEPDEARPPQLRHFIAKEREA